jgi:hypothetical protein
LWWMDGSSRQPGLDQFVLAQERAHAQDAPYLRLAVIVPPAVTETSLKPGVESCGSSCCWRNAAGEMNGMLTPMFIARGMSRT